MWAQVVNTILGLWLMAAPAVLGHAGQPLGKFDRAIGPAVAAVSFVAVAQISRSVRWLTMPLAAVLLVVPWILDAPTASKVNSVVVAAAMLLLAPLGRPDQRRYGNGWSTLRGDGDLPPWGAPRGEEITRR